MPKVLHYVSGFFFLLLLFISICHKISGLCVVPFAGFLFFPQMEHLLPRTKKNLNAAWQKNPGFDFLWLLNTPLAYFFIYLTGKGHPNHGLNAFGRAGRMLPLGLLLGLTGTHVSLDVFPKTTPI